MMTSKEEESRKMDNNWSGIAIADNRHVHKFHALSSPEASSKLGLSRCRVS